MGTSTADCWILPITAQNFTPPHSSRWVRFHSANSDLFYVYTMVDRDHVPYFILDTATDGNLRTEHHLHASGYMQPFKLRHEYKDGWLDQIAAGKTFTPLNPFS